MKECSDVGCGRRGMALALLCAVQFVDVLDVNVVIVALPSIGRDLGFSAGDLQWLVTAYVLFLRDSCCSPGGWRTFPFFASAGLAVLGVLVAIYVVREKKER